MPKSINSSKNGVSVARYPTQNDLALHVREKMIVLLNQELANLADLHSQTKQAHWNVKGMHFIQLHELFDDLAEALEDYIDAVAERVTALGGYAMGTVRMAAASSTLPEFPTDLADSRPFVEVLVKHFAQAGASVRAGIDAAALAGDQDTADLLTEVSRGMDKHLWFLEAHLQK